MGRRKKREPQPFVPDWQGFYKLLAIGEARLMGILPTPPEVLERLKEREKAGKPQAG